ncbi:hypothetical protein EVAR_61891_1 [Eumeta japonica]|uniref:Uncharacterized protein n=1 Tax=Eumeta variegata TaxID=151549 RepID=A0A4C1YYJ8_EUMVA|nr:hypothetical protein EVAR_61891_1 [Eumeta japonica]
MKITEPIKEDCREEMKIEAEIRAVRSVETSQMTSQTTLIVSPSTAGRHIRECRRRHALWTTPGGSRLGMSQETVTGRCPSSRSGREAVSGGRVGGSLGR